MPFREVYVHGLIRDHDGQKMSKSKGNVIDPLDIVDGISLEALLAKRTSGLMQPQMKPAIERATRKQFPHGIPAFGTDALRLCFARLATQSRDLRFDMSTSRGVPQLLQQALERGALRADECRGSGSGAPSGAEFSLADRWIQHAARGDAARSATAGFADYRLDVVANALYEFTWHEFCDWYLELSKAVLQSETAAGAAKRGTRRHVDQRASRRCCARCIRSRPSSARKSGSVCARFAGGGRRHHHARAVSRTPLRSTADPDAEAEMRWVMRLHRGRAPDPRRDGHCAEPQARGAAAKRRRHGTPSIWTRNLQYLVRLAGIERPACCGPAQAAPISAVALRRHAGNTGAHGRPDRSGRRTGAPGEAAAQGRGRSRRNWRAN